MFTRLFAVNKGVVIIILDIILNLMVHISTLLGIVMIAVVMRKSRNSSVRSAFLILLSIVTLWNIGTLLELDFRLVTGVTYISFVNICYIGICLVPIAILYLGRIVMRSDWKPKPIHALFLVIPVFSIIMVFTDPLHHLFFVNFSLYSKDAVYGVYYYFHSVYSYGCIFAGIVLMYIASSHNLAFFSKQSLLVIFGVVVTLVPNILYSFGFMNLPFSVSSAAFTVSILPFAVAFLKYRFTEVFPITLKQVMNLISDGYLVIDRQFRVLSYNNALVRMLPDFIDVTRSESLRMVVERYFLENKYDKILEWHKQAVDRQETVSFEDRIADYYVNVEITPVIQHNSHLGSIILLKDITQSKLLIEATQAGSKAKGDFLSHMSHEIRTPLNAIIGMINIGINTNDVEKMKYCFERADGASKHLLSLINDILDMSKIEADKFELSFSEFEFEKMLMNITNVANIRADEKSQNFVVNLSKDIPAYIESDELRLSQVITNLLTNAIKFTPEKGTVSLNIDLESKNAESDEVTLRIEVSDTGIGISKEQQERLFTSYNQADSSISHKFGGTGLGLAISKRIVELMEGHIWIESELGRGSKFIFTVNAKKRSGNPKTKLSRGVNFESMRVLAVDDSVEVRDYFIYVMEELGVFCHVAASGAEAVEMIENSGDKPYNIFFVDWLMPEMDGIELTKQIKKINGDNSVITMISVADWNSIEKEAVAAGVRHFISKPLFPSELINAINICISETSGDLSNDSSNPVKQRHDFSGHTLLVAEDIEINREIISAVLEETGVAIDYAEDGKLAVSMFSENPDKYALILMDIQMPEMDGYEASLAIRALDLEKAENIPIIAMTANVFKEDIEKCIASGMNEHMGKPVDTDVLLGLLSKYLK